MKNIKVFGLAIAASIIAVPALAGETYVRNESIDSWGYTKTDLEIDSTTWSGRNEIYGSYADKTYTDTDISFEGGGRKKPLEVVSYESTEHNAGSLLLGSFYENVDTTVWGKIHSYSAFDSSAHETSSGVR